MRSESGNPLVFLSVVFEKIPPHKSLQRSWNHKFCTIPNPLKLDRGDTDPSHKCKLFLSRAKIQTPQRGVHGSQVHQIVSSNPWMMGEFSVTNCVWFPGENSLRDFPSKINPLMVTHPVAGSCWKSRPFALQEAAARKQKEQLLREAHCWKECEAGVATIENPWKKCSGVVRAGLRKSGC